MRVRPVIKSRKISKNRTIFIAAVTALTLLCGTCLAAFLAVGNMLGAQQAAERFRGDSETRFAQVSAFFPVGAGKSLSDIYTFRQSVETALTGASLEAPENGSLWTDAYSAEAKITLTGSRGSASVTALGVGGDWFFFHPLRLLSGGYIRETDLMHDRVVLDEALAWKLFGGTDLAGMTVTIGDKPYIVAGVIARETDFASKKAYGGEAGLFMSYDVMNDVSPADISSYELCCADPISGFALDVAETGFPDAVVLQNTGRFSFGSAVGLLRHFGERSMDADGVIFPYWENAARYAEDYAALFLTLAAVFGLFPLFFTVRLLVRIFIKIKVRLAGLIPAWWETLSDKIRRRQRLRLEEKEHSKS